MEVNDNQPEFTEEELTTVSYENYSELDELGRCQSAEACIGQDLMPTEARESISSVKPTGWKNKSYDTVDGGYVYNRCPALCAGMAAPAFAFEGEAAPVEQPVLPEVVEEDVVTVTDETSGALTPEGNLTLVDDYHTNYSDGSGQQFITLVSKSGNTFYLVIDRNAKGQQTVHFMNLVDEADLLALMEEEAADAYTAEKEAAAQAELDRLKAEEEAKKAEEEAATAEPPKENKITKYAGAFLGIVALIALAAGGGFYFYRQQMQKKKAEKEALDPDADYTEDKGDFEIPTDVPDEDEAPDEQDTEPI